MVEKDARGLRVVEQNNPNSTASFSYCIWGKRKDIPNERLAPVENTRKNEKFKPHNGPVPQTKPIDPPKSPLGRGPAVGPQG